MATPLKAKTKLVNGVRTPVSSITSPTGTPTASSNAPAQPTAPTYTQGNTRNGVPIPDRVVVNGKSKPYEDVAGVVPTSAAKYDNTTPIDAEVVAQNQQSIPFAPAPQADMASANALVSSIGQTQQIQTAYDQEVAQREQEVTKQQGALTRLAERFDVTDSFKRAQKDAGVPNLTKQLQQANLQLAQMQSQYQMTNQELAQQTVPQAFIIGQQNELGKTAAIQIGAQAAYVQALQGNLDLANHYVDKIVELQAKDFEVQYNTQKYNLDLALGYLDRADKKQAQQISYQLDLQKADYTSMLEAKKSSMNNALLNGAPSSVVQEIARATTLDQVYSSAGKYGVDAVAQAQLTTERLQQAKIQAELSGGSSDKKYTQDQIKNAGFAQRTSQANEVINKLGGQFTGIQSYAGQVLPNYLKSESRQKYEQAQRNFINSILRRESGAVISEEEFTNAKLQYFPQPGDAIATVEQKRQNRETVIANLIQGSGGSAFPQESDYLDNIGL